MHAELKDDKTLALETVNMGYLLNAAEAARKIRIVILDACRDNPFVKQLRQAAASRSVGAVGSGLIGKGLARIEPDAGTIVLYAAKHGEVALEGDGKNSPFVEALVKRIEQKPAREVRRLFDLVRDDVVESTNKQQQPFHYGSLSGSEDFFFVR